MLIMHQNMHMCTKLIVKQLQEIIKLIYNAGLFSETTFILVRQCVGGNSHLQSQF